jgi:hypothetical protein
MPVASRTNKQTPIAATRAAARYAHDLNAHAIDQNAGKIVKIDGTIGGRATCAIVKSQKSEFFSRPLLQKSLKRAALNCVFLVVCWIDRWPSQSWMRRVSWPALASA